MPSLILIVDDDPVQRRLMASALGRAGYRTATATSGAEALEAFDGEGRIDAVVLDLVMPGMDGLAVLAALRQRGFTTPVIVQTARGGIETAVAAMRAGAFDFVVKPAPPERLAETIAAALKVEAKAARAPANPPRPAGFDEIVTRSPLMAGVLALARKAASSDIPVLIEGESGSGKELIARALQAAGSRASRPFITVNCGAVPAALVESILFGHEKGAFTGATEKHAGKFVEANGGTLFLDEVGDLPPDMQVKLLRAVQNGEIDPVGGRSAVKVDIRLISATHRDLEREVAEGRFREDLFYRLNVLPIAVPPLRDRSEDIPALAMHFLTRFGAQAGRPDVRAIAPEALALLRAHDWPGNIRQLENALFRAVVLADGPVLTADAFPQIRAQVEGIDLARHAPLAPDLPGGSLTVAESPESARATETGFIASMDQRGHMRTLADVEQDMIRMALGHYQGQMSEVARRLGIGRSTLYRKLKDYGIEHDGAEAGRSSQER